MRKVFTLVTDTSTNTISRRSIPFGYGLSYTHFGYSDLKISPAKASGNSQFKVTLKLANQGKRAGAEVVQLYVHDGHSAVDRPVKELKAFRRVELSPGQSTGCEFRPG